MITPSSASGTFPGRARFPCRLYGLHPAVLLHHSTCPTSFFVWVSIVCTPCKLYERERLGLHGHPGEK